MLSCTPYLHITTYTAPTQTQLEHIGILLTSQLAHRTSPVLPLEHRRPDKGSEQGSTHSSEPDDISYASSA